MSLQENFELNHETLYLAVKLVDHYLVEVVSMKDKLQLIGSTAILIASKFEVTPGVRCWGAFWRMLGPRGTEGGVSIPVLLLPIPGAANVALVGWILPPGDLVLLHCAETTRTPGFSPGGCCDGPGRCALRGPANSVGSLKRCQDEAL